MSSGSSRGSVTRIYQGLRTGNEDAARELWLRFFARTVSLARQRLRNAPRQVRDEEDIALSAFESLCRGAQRGQFPLALDRESLWRLLVTITARKASDEVAYQRRAKRDVKRETRVASTASGDDESGSDLIAQLTSREPSPALTAQLGEEATRLLDALPDGDLREVALLKMEGYTNAEISARLDRSLATIARKLQTIRSLWSERA